MSNIAIHCASLSKRYRIGERPTNSLREALMHRLAAPLRRHKGAHGNDSTIWALRDLSCQIGEGEVVGIIGRNGAGKSTLLKVLSRITEPTQGFEYPHIAAKRRTMIRIMQIRIIASLWSKRTS